MLNDERRINFYSAFRIRHSAFDSDSISIACGARSRPLFHKPMTAAKTKIGKVRNGKADSTLGEVTAMPAQISARQANKEISTAPGRYRFMRAAPFDLEVVRKFVVEPERQAQFSPSKGIE